MICFLPIREPVPGSGPGAAGSHLGGCHEWGWNLPEKGLAATGSTATGWRGGTWILLLTLEPWIPTCRHSSRSGFPPADTNLALDSPMQALISLWIPTCRRSFHSGFLHARTHHMHEAPPSRPRPSQSFYLLTPSPWKTGCQHTNLERHRCSGPSCALSNRT